MAEPILSAARLRELLHYDPETGAFTRLKTAGSVAPAGSSPGCINKSGYLVIRLDYRLYYAHRLAWLYVHGEWPTDQIDHINGIKADNRLHNLRNVTAQANVQNVRGPAVHNKSSGLLGATWSARTKKWHAQIGVDMKHINLGKYATAEEAHQAYLTAKRRLHPGCTI